MTDGNSWPAGPARATLSPPGIAVLRVTRNAEGGREIFNVATIERAAERLAEASGERPLVGRLKYLRGMNFPSPVAKGRGSKAVLGLDDLVQTLFALELMHAGMAPTRAIRVLRTDWTMAKVAIAYGWSRANGIGPAKRPLRTLMLAPSVLSELGSDDRADEPLREAVGVLSATELSKLQTRGDAPRRLLMIDTQAFAVALTQLGETVLGVTDDKFASEMRMFCAEAFGTEETAKWDAGGVAGKVFHEE